MKRDREMDRVIPWLHSSIEKQLMGKMERLKPLAGPLNQPICRRISRKAGMSSDPAGSTHRAEPMTNDLHVSV
jgi:hypothetical protein